MPITLTCPGCGFTAQAPDQLRGQSTRCPKCHARFRAVGTDLAGGKVPSSTATAKPPAPIPVAVAVPVQQAASPDASCAAPLAVAIPAYQPPAQRREIRSWLLVAFIAGSLLVACCVVTVVVLLNSVSVNPERLIVGEWAAGQTHWYFGADGTYRNWLKHSNGTQLMDHGSWRWLVPPGRDWPHHGTVEVHRYGRNELNPDDHIIRDWPYTIEVQFPDTDTAAFSGGVTTQLRRVR